MSKKQVRQFIRSLKDRGWYEDGITGSGHHMMRYIPGGFMTISATPSDYRWIFKAESLAKKIEKENGPYIPTKKEEVSSRGLDYQKPTTDDNIFPSLGDNVNNFLATLKVENNEEPVVIERKGVLFRPEIVEKPKPMGNIGMDKDVILFVMQEKYNSLKKELEPLLEKFEQFKQIEKVINNIQRSAIPDEAKVSEFLENSKPLIKSVKKPKEVYRRLDNYELYDFIKEIIQSHNNRMEIKEVLDWLEKIKNITLGTGGVTPKTDLVKRIKYVEKIRPEMACLYLEKINGEYRYIGVK